jgi:hypothetical protein
MTEAQANPCTVCLTEVLPDVNAPVGSVVTLVPAFAGDDVLGEELREPSAPGSRGRRLSLWPPLTPALSPQAGRGMLKAEM